MKYDANGLMPAVVQDSITNEVLMVAWVNGEALQLMKETGYTHFWSRSRNKLWKKGEESGNVQRIVSIQTDCDSDTLLVRVVQTGVACHTGSPSCFGETVYGDTSSTAAILPDLKRVIEDRIANPEEGSYTCKLLRDENKLSKKIIEEATEFVLSFKDGDEDGMAWELADVIYHTMVAVEKSSLPMDKVYSKLSERRQ